MRCVPLMCAAAVLSTAARAADLPELPPLPFPEERIENFVGGWYLRGDIGYRFNQIGSASTIVPPSPNQNHINPSGMVGLGLGYKNGWFRADVTFDYGTTAKYYGDTAIMPIHYTTRIESFTGLANLYADLGTWVGLTPYIGGGAGGSYLRTLDFHDATAVPAISSATGGGLHFAWALMAGISYGFGNVVIDLGYRRLDLGTVATQVDAFGNRLELKNLVADEIRLGMRFAM